MQRSIQRSIVSAALILPGLFSCLHRDALAQSQSINGTIRGHVADATGASVGGAQVTVKNAEVGYTKTLQTASDGYFVLLNLPLGHYSVDVSMTGFSPVAYANLTVTAGREIVLDPTLTVGGTSTEIQVSAQSAAIDPATLDIGRTIDSREVENLPLTSRNPYNFILFQPGVSGHPNPELGIPRTINTNGLLDRINYQLDGMVNTQSDRYGLRLFPIGNVFVKEVQTVSNSFAPEFGWSAGNVYNVISNNGTNQFHGLFQYIRRWQDATAFPLLTNRATTPIKPDLQLSDYSANLGGPVLRNRLFFFGSYEQLKRGVPAPVTITQANASAIGLPASELVTAPGLLNGKFVDARVDWTISSRNQFFLRYNYFKNTFPLNTQVGGLNARSAGVDYADRAHVFGGQLITTLSDHLLNELRISVPLRDNTHFAGSYTGTGPAVIITGVANFNGTSSAGDRFTEKQPSGSDNVSYVRGRHTIKAGFNFSQIEDKQQADSFNAYTFPTVAAYLAAKNGTNPYGYTQFASQTDAAGVNYASQFFGSYVQDTWAITPRLLAIFGGRYDRFQAPRANANAPYADSRHFNVPSTDFSPRVGFSYRFTDKTVIKASAGIFYQAPPTNVWYNALSLDGTNRTSAYTYTPSQAGAPAYPNIPSATGKVAVQNVTTVSPNFRNEYTWNFNTQISQEFSNHDAMTIGYILANGRNLQYLHNINVINPIGSLADGRPVFSTLVSAATRADPRFNQVNRVETGANSSFNALVVSYTRYLARGLQFNANYTWSHTISDAPEVNTFEQNLPIEDTTNLKRGRGNSSVNRPNAFNMSAVLEPSFDLNNRFAKEVVNHNRLALLLNLSSGDQSSVIANPGIINGDSSVTSVARPAFVARNTVRSPSIYQVDARYTRSISKIYDRFEPSFLIEANNLLNHSNVTSVAVSQPVTPFSAALGVPNGGVATGTPTVSRTTVLEARIVQFGAAVRF